MSRLRRGDAVLRSLFVLTVLLAVSTGAPAYAGSWVHGNYVSTSGARGFQLWVPDGYQPGTPLPLVVALHGCFQNPDQFAGLTRLNTKADAERFLVLYPNQATFANPTQCWNFMFGANQERGTGEPALVVGMVDLVKQHYSVDARRVYLGGVSSGAVLTGTLMACYSDVFAAGMIGAGAMYKAATTVSGTGFAMLFGSIYSPDDRGRDAWVCSGRPRRTVPVLVVHGTEDSVVNPLNGEQAVKQFLQTSDYGDDGLANDSIRSTPTATRTLRVPGGRTYTVKDYVYGGELVAQKYEIQGMDHAWPGGDASYPFADPSGPDATTFMWDFFKQHTLDWP
ncbi:PHB depolymerase family esterase [Myxococcus sp. K15C18031901]|uniref:extracellular catalytic domain type 1 short-chain-length polyhydroxyalkanoate depolymerase n=1 Tax=Myxococcus dinghuensis TaxID=2906761 RepID=UPI0020A6E758|nr:PHB depolymerase family esterase [Myxococcus dinghuensis]MCP3104000.1 PHB depolymerase family esterase [Myxococcus dinghuensis]